MTTLLTCLTAAVSLFVVVGIIWLATWTYTRFQITCFIWVALTRITSLLSTALLMPILGKADAVVLKTLQQYSDLPEPDLLLTIGMFKTICPLIGLICLALIAVGEIGHLSPKLRAGYTPPRAIIGLYRLRWLWGVAAMVLTLAPGLLWFWLSQKAGVSPSP